MGTVEIGRNNVVVKVKPIKPDPDYLNPARIEGAIFNTLRAASRDIKKDFESTTDNWEHEVEFSTTINRDGITVETDDPVYNFVDSGTRPHDIAAKGSKSLRYTADGQPKTFVRDLKSRRGRSGGAVRFRRKVRHPGVEAREFSKMIQEKYEEEMPKRIDAAIEKALKV